MKIVFITMLAVGFSTVFGSIAGLLIRRIPHRYNDAVLGIAAGVMLAAAVLGLIVPAAEFPVKFSLAMTVGGVVAGALVVSFLDRVTPHLHRLAGLDREKHPADRGVNRVLLFVSAIAIHKLPEGLAAGVSLGTENLGDVITVAGSISLQNIPEAMVIVAPLLAVGVTMWRTILISLSIGVVSMAGTLLGFFMVSQSVAVMPFMLAFAGGTMLYVVSDEMIPETHSHGFEKGATFALLSGFLLILVIHQLAG